jgi:hypothetical protein
MRTFKGTGSLFLSVAMLIVSAGVLEASGSTVPPSGSVTNFCVDYSNGVPPTGLPQTFGLFTDIRRNPEINAGPGNCNLNFTGFANNASDMWITLLRAPGSGITTFGNVEVEGNIVIHTFNNRKGIGWVALYNDSTKRGIFLGVFDNGNTDGLTLMTFNSSTGQATALTNVPLGSTILENTEYNLKLQVTVGGDSLHVHGSVRPAASVTSDCTGDDSCLDFDGSLSALALPSSGEIGIAAQAKLAVVDSSVLSFAWGPVEP